MTEKEKEYRTERLLKITAECNEMTSECLTTTELGRPLGMTAKEVYKTLCQMGVLFYENGCYMLDEEYEGRGLMLYRYFVYFSKDGERRVKQYPVWTHNGVTVMRKLIIKGEQ